MAAKTKREKTLGETQTWDDSIQNILRGNGMRSKHKLQTSNSRVLSFNNTSILIGKTVLIN
jgi:hypothetical protein